MVLSRLFNSIRPFTNSTFNIFPVPDVDDKSVASCPQTCCKLFQQVVISPQIISCNKSDFNRFAATWEN